MSIGFPKHEVGNVDWSLWRLKTAFIVMQNAAFCNVIMTILCDEKAFFVRCIAENDLQVSCLLTIRDDLMLFRIFGSDKNKVLKNSGV